MAQFGFRLHGLAHYNENWLALLLFIPPSSNFVACIIFTFSVLKILSSAAIVPTLINLIAILKWIQAYHESLHWGSSIPESFILIQFFVSRIVSLGNFFSKKGSQFRFENVYYFSLEQCNILDSHVLSYCSTVSCHWIFL